jgi:hypothetical protein
LKVRFGNIGAVALAALFAVGTTAGEKKDAKRGGTILGTVTARGDTFVEVRADGEEKGRKYVPHWVGGAPAQGGGFNKETLKSIRAVKVGSRVKLDWEFEERPRVVRIQVLKAAGGGEEKKDREEKKGARIESEKRRLIGTLTAKGPKFIEVKADGEERARKYLLHRGGTKELLQAMRDTPLGTRVRMEWMFLEHPRVLSLAPVSGGVKNGK